MAKKKKASSRKKARIVDIHNHVNWYGFNADQVVENLNEHKIDKVWLLTWEAPADEIDLANYSGVFAPGQIGMPIKDVLDARDRHPDRFIPFYAADPRDPNVINKLEGAVKHYGIRGYGELKIRIMLDDPRALEVFHFCGENGLPVIFHMDVPLPRRQLGREPGYWYCCDWDNLDRALTLCPNTTFIGHAPGFWREITGDADRSPDAYPTGKVKPFGKLWMFMDKYPNLYCDLSAGSGLNAISRDPDKGREFLLKYADRCLFGRDSFDGRLYKFLTGLKLPKPVLAKILSGNALKLVPV